MLDLRTVVVESLDRLLASGEVEKQIDEAVKTCVAGVINSQLRDTYSDFGNELERVVKQAFHLNGEIDLTPYNDVVVKVVREQLDKFAREAAAKQVGERIAGLLKAPPATIKLSKLVELYVEHVKSHQSMSCHCDSTGRITLHVREDDGLCRGYREVYLDEKAGKRMIECRIHLRANAEGKVWAVHIGGHEIQKTIYAGPLFGFEKAVFDMSVAGTVIEFDESPHLIDLSYSLIDD